MAVVQTTSCFEGMDLRPSIKFLDDAGSVEPKTFYKFVADIYASAPVVAFFDDDACLRDHMIPQAVAAVESASSPVPICA
jgi:hypothetical protein